MAASPVVATSAQLLLKQRLCSVKKHFEPFVCLAICQRPQVNLDLSCVYGLSLCVCVLFDSLMSNFMLYWLVIDFCLQVCTLTWRSALYLWLRIADCWYHICMWSRCLYWGTVAWGHIYEMHHLYLCGKVLIWRLHYKFWSCRSPLVECMSLSGWP